MRGFFGVGVEGISKGANLGNLVRSTHAFGGQFFFTVQTSLDLEAVRASDTSDAFDHVPFYDFENADALMLPKGCQLVAVELTPDAVELPSFRHPTRAAYILGPEMGNVSPEIQAKCDHIIKIPMKFCVNVGVAGALVMYDRMISMGRLRRVLSLRAGRLKTCLSRYGSRAGLLVSNGHRECDKYTSDCH